MIPLPDECEPVTFFEGFTPLIPVGVSGKVIFIKQDQLFPSGSYKDRGATVLISLARYLGITKVVEDSSGNAGCAIAAYCARAGIRCSIYVPEGTSPGKLAQIGKYGAELHLIPGTREDTAAAVLAAAETDYYASHSWNPFFFHGTKTWAYEVCEQLGWRAPDIIVLPAGNGTLLLGAAIGFGELRDMGIVAKIPKIIAVQAEGCAPLAKAYRERLESVPVIERFDTLAEGIAIADPVRGKQIIDTVRKDDGMFVTVSEVEIRESLLDMCKSGFYIEPTAAAVIAGLKKYLEFSSPGELIVTTFTGSGLKATEKMIKL